MSRAAERIGFDTGGAAAASGAGSEDDPGPDATDGRVPVGTSSGSLTDGPSTAS